MPEIFAGKNDHSVLTRGDDGFMMHPIPIAR